MSYIIIKLIKDQKSDRELPVVILDTHGDILEYNTVEEAEEMRSKFEVNSDSGYRYKIKKLGKIFNFPF